MKKIIILLLLLSIFTITCDNKRTIKQKIWTLSYSQDDSTITKFAKLEVYDSFGNLSYDSTIYAMDYGYGITRYNDGLPVYEYSQIKPDIISEHFHEYDGKTLTKTITYSDGDTLISRFIIENKNHYGKPLKILTLNSRNDSLGFESRTYLDTLLISTEVFIKTDTSNNLINRKNISYNQMMKKKLEVVTDYLNSIKDSTITEYQNNKISHKTSFVKRIGDQYTKSREQNLSWVKNTLTKHTFIEYSDNDSEKRTFKAEVEWW